MEKKTAYLHFGGPFTSEQPAPRLTIETEVKQEELWWQKRGLSYTATGYGRRIPTEYKVQYNGRWQRVYCCIYSNNGVLYIQSKGKAIATVDIY
jgi:hypothetical protein